MGRKSIRDCSRRQEISLCLQNSTLFRCNPMAAIGEPIPWKSIAFEGVLSAMKALSTLITLWCYSFMYKLPLDLLQSMSGGLALVDQYLDTPCRNLVAGGPHPFKLTIIRARNMLLKINSHSGECNRFCSRRQHLPFLLLLWNIQISQLLSLPGNMVKAKMRKQYSLWICKLWHMNCGLGVYLERPMATLWFSHRAV